MATEILFNFCFQCPECERPILSWMLTPPHSGGKTLDDALAQEWDLTCVTNCGWSGKLKGTEAKFNSQADWVREG